MWGFELLRDGDRVGEHLNRFGPGGRYTELALKDYRVIDFQPVPESGRFASVDREKLVRVYMTNDMRPAAIVSKRGRTELRH